MLNHLYAWPIAAVFAWLPVQVFATCQSASAAADDVVMAQHRAYVAHDIDAFASCYADDLVITDLTGQMPPIVGIAALRARYASLFRRMPAGFHSEYLGKMVNGATVAVNERSVGGPRGTTQGGMVLFEVREGRIVRVWFGPMK